MHKIVVALTAIFTFLSLNIFSQIENKRFYLDGNISFSKENSLKTYDDLSDFYYVPQDDEFFKKNEFGFSPNIGYILCKNFIVGVGFKYHQKHIIYTLQNTPTPSTSGFLENPIPVEYEVVSKQMVPSVFVKYVKKINNFINIGIKTGVAYGIENVNENVIDNDNYIEPNIIPSGINENNYVILAPNRNTNTKQLNIFLSPEVQLMLTKNIGVQLNFNMFNYTITKTEKLSTTENTKDYDFNLNPSNWVMGVLFYFGDKKSATND
ncbi:MAG: hypothetical protein IPO21_10945 [Bacteroidales bacterium]|nr:hypothetical protein [Bacteroidales bacterium]